jgi:hypothetical protein
VTLLVFFSSRWTTYAYFAMLAPVALVIPLLFAADVRPRSAAPTAVAAA